MNLRHDLRRLFAQPPHLTAAKLWGRLRGAAGQRRARRRDLRRPTYARLPAGMPPAPQPYVDGLDFAALAADVASLKRLAAHYVQHRFDLLGSGWLQVAHGIRCRGVEGHVYEPADGVQPDRSGRWLQGRVNAANLEHAQRIWSLVDAGYAPIDWQLDFKSGYRWSERTWAGEIRYGHLPGVDVKLPWELARMQHLPQMALLYGALRKDPAEQAAARRLAAEFRNQVLDFAATNPPRFGVNWHCTMDVAIRAANWLLAWNLFAAAGAAWDEAFAREFVRTIYDHGRHVIAHLEWNPQLRANHYLADVAGLLWIAACLPRSRETDAWLAFAVRQLVAEVQTQFAAEGTNFEASTCYHRLSAEMVAWCTALVLGLDESKHAALREYDHCAVRVAAGLPPAPVPLYDVATMVASPLPAWFIDRLQRMAEFTMHISKPDGRVPQIGDNDNGRFFKLQPAFADAPAGHACEDHLDHRHLVAAINGLFEREDLSTFAGEWPDAAVIRRLYGGAGLPSHRGAEPAAAERARIEDPDAEARAAARCPQRKTLTIPIPGDDIGEGLQACAYPAFGYFVIRSPRLYLGIRCGGVGQNGNGGHAHNDQLSIELTVDGRDWIADPGTYLYTPLPARRNAYRGAAAHSGPRLEGRAEPGCPERSLFQLGREAGGEALHFDGRRFVGVHHGYGEAVYCAIEVLPGALQITAYTASDAPLVIGAEAWLHGGKGPLAFSPGYGSVQRGAALSGPAGLHRRVPASRAAVTRPSR